MDRKHGTTVGNAAAALAEARAELREATAACNTTRARQLEDKIAQLEAGATGFGAGDPIDSHLRRHRNKGEA